MNTALSPAPSVNNTGLDNLLQLIAIGRPRNGEIAMIAVTLEGWPADGRKDD